MDISCVRVLLLTVNAGTAVPSALILSAVTGFDSGVWLSGETIGSSGRDDFIPGLSCYP